MPTNRCQYDKVVDKFTKRPRVCRSKRFILGYCHIHCKLSYNDQVIKIQSLYRGHYTRCKLKIFYKLPRELQRKIIWHMNDDIYARHRNKSIVNILYNKYIKFYYDGDNKKILKDVESDVSVTELFEKDLKILIILTIRYNSLFDKSKIPLMIRKLLIVFVAKYYITYYRDNLLPTRCSTINNSILYRYYNLIRE